MTKLVLSAGKPVLVELKSLLHKAEVIMDKSLGIKDVNRKKKAYSIRVSWITGKIILIIDDNFLVDFLNLYGNVFLAGVTLSKTMMDFKAAHDRLCDKWFNEDRANEGVVVCHKSSTGQKCPFGHMDMGGCFGCNVNNTNLFNLQ